ncbi:MAG: PfkB family carbohydrate kinase, partial [Chloroflexota bacterium]
VGTPYLPRLGETVIGDAWWWKPGGKGGNQAMAAARHGAATVMIGALGDDGFGERLRERLAAAGVSLAAIRTVGAGSGRCVAIQEAAGDYAAIVVSGANRRIDAEQVAASADAIRDAAILVLQDEVGEPANAAAARIARAVGVTVLLNAAPARPLGALAGLIDVLVVNAVEAEQLGAPAVTDLAGAGRAAEALRGLAPTVVVTAGGAGVAAVSATERVALAAHPVVRPETHGAGDLFVGALAVRLAAGDPLAGALRYANAAAALHVGTPESARDALGPAEVRALLARG